MQIYSCFESCCVYNPLVTREGECSLSAIQNNIGISGSCFENLLVSQNWHQSGCQDPDAVPLAFFPSSSLTGILVSRLSCRPAFSVWKKNIYTFSSLYLSSGVLTRSISPFHHLIMSVSLPVLMTHSIYLVLLEDIVILSHSAGFSNSKLTGLHGGLDSRTPFRPKI